MGRRASDGTSIFLNELRQLARRLRPFLDRMDLKTKHTERLFRSDRSELESFVTFAPDDKTFFTWHQSPTDPPNLMLRTPAAPVAGAKPTKAAFASTSRAITQYSDPTPAVRAIKSSS